MKSHQDREYVSSVTLLVLGEHLDPDKVSAELRLADEYKDSSLEDQLGYWTGLLASRIAALRRLTLSGLECALDVLVTSGETASIVLSNQLQKEVAALGVEVQISFWASAESEQAAAGDARNARA